MKYNTQQKAEKGITYAIETAATVGSAISAFNNCASEIKSNTYEQLCVLIDGELA